MAMVPQRFVSLALDLARLANQTFATLDLDAEVETKADGSPVTAVDRAIEAMLRRELAARAPEHGIVGEEYGNQGEDRDWVWILDPIDGTRQFITGLPSFGTLIALCHEGRPVVGVIGQPLTGSICHGVVGAGTWLDGRIVRTSATKHLRTAVAGLCDPDSIDAGRRPGFDVVQKESRINVYDGGCIAYVALARGRIDICLNGPNLEPFDIAALVPVVEGAGGRISDWRGGALDQHSAGAIVAAATPALHDEVLARIAGETVTDI